MTIYFASDHAGASLRKTLLSYVQATGHDVVDLGSQKTASVDYPDFGVKLAMALILGTATEAREEHEEQA